MWDDIKDFLMFIVAMVCTTAAIVSVIVGIAWVSNKVECSSYEDMTGRATKFSWGTCYVNDGSTFIPYTEYKELQVGKKVVLQ